MTTHTGGFSLQKKVNMQSSVGALTHHSAEIPVDSLKSAVIKQQQVETSDIKMSIS